MKTDAHALNDKHFTPLTSMLITGADLFLCEKAYLKIQSFIKKKNDDRPHVFDLDASGFNWQPIYSLANNGSLFDELTFITLKSKTALKKSQHDELLQLISKSSDVIFILILPKLTKAQEKQAWIQTIIKQGLVISADPLAHYKLPQLIKQQLKEKSLQTTQEGCELLANSFEGNLLGLEQEIEKLSLIFTEGMISFEELAQNISNQSHASIFQCIDHALAKNTLKSQKILQQLNRDKTEPAIILWAIVKELRTLISMKFDMNKGESLTNTLNKYHIWQSKKAMFQTQLQNRPLADFYHFMQAAKNIDASIKGLSNLNAWQLLATLLLKIAS